MSRLEFKQRYFTNNFYWVNKDNYKELQEIGIMFDCVNPLGNKDIIEWHDGFKNLGFRTYEKNNGVTKFQKEPFLLHNENATSFSDMINDFKQLIN